jgi:aspartyl-tRNA(Asn)/glutamyl-tRNA(Gln) amidotransferase subunit A
MRAANIAFPTIAEAGQLIAARKLSPTELTRTLLARIDGTNERLHAFVTVTEKHALAAARGAERALRTGKRGRLLGIPLGYKDIFDTAGVATTACSRILAENTPREDAEAVRRLSAAGAVMLGKLTTHEFAIGGPAFDLPWPPARNPWNADRFTGGSSSGAGAAVAAGLVLGALGSDSAGSIRMPAAYCGIAGLKPTAGLVSRRGTIPLSPSFDTVGPMAWTVEDCAILLDALAGHDPQDPASRPAPRSTGSYARGLAAPVKGLRIGVLRQTYEREAPVCAESLQLMGRSLGVLRDLGCRVDEAVLPPLDLCVAVARTLISSEAFALHESTLQTRLSDYSRSFRLRVLPGALVRAADYIAAHRQRSTLAATIQSLFQRFDILVGAAAAGPAPTLAELRPEELVSRPYAGMAANLAGLPALVVCAGSSASGLPLGIEFMGHAWEDGLVLRLGHQFETAMGTRSARPAI